MLIQTMMVVIMIYDDEGWGGDEDDDDDADAVDNDDKQTIRTTWYWPQKGDITRWVGHGIVVSGQRHYFVPGRSKSVSFQHSYYVVKCPL